MNFQASKGCMNCTGTPKYTLEQVQKIFSDSGCKLISNIYENATKQLLGYECECGNESEITLGNFMAGHRCKKCGQKKIWDKRRISYNTVFNYFKKYNCRLITDYYKDESQLLEYECSCDNISYKTYKQFKKSKICDGCRNIKRNRWNKNTIPITLFELIDKLLRDNIIKDIDDIPKVINHKTFINYGYTDIFRIYFKGSTYNAMNYIFPDRWKPWEFKNTPSGIWKDKNNHKLAWNWFIEQLIKDDIIKEEKDIIPIFDSSLLKKYGLSGLFEKYKKRSFEFLSNFIDCYEWETKQVPMGFWNKQDNRIKAMMQYLDKNNINIDDIPKLFTFTYFQNHRFESPLKKHYDCNIFNWINDCFPNKFKPENFNLFIASDGIKLKSYGELLIHEYLIDKFSNVIYYRGNSNDIKWHNNEKDENYIADWLIIDNIIVEFFGLYQKRNKAKYIKEYVQKTDNKIEYYNNLDNYNFVALFPVDLQKDLSGVKEKFKQYID